MKNWSIKKKVWLALTAMIVTIIIGACFLILFLYNELYVEKQKELLVMEGKQIGDYFDTYGPNEAFVERLRWTEQNKAINVLYSDDPMQLGSGVPFGPYSQGNVITFQERQQLLDGKTVVMIRPHPHFEQDILGVAIPLFQNGNLAGSVLLSMPLADVYEPFTEVRTIIIVTLILIIILIAFIGNQVINHIVRPLYEMKVTSKLMADGDFTRRINVNRADELGQLANSFNVLSTSLEKVDENRREFLANVSHELRTPLSYMKGYAEAIEEGMIDQKRGIEIIQTESDRLERLVNDLLDLAQLEGDSYPLRLEPVAFAQLVNDVIQSLQVIAVKKNIKLQCNLNEESIVYGDSDRLEQVIRNLLDNAIRHTPEMKDIWITLMSNNGRSELVIADEGEGIPEEELLAVKERFYRVNKARTRHNGGTGLGLSIVSEIIKKHDGTFELQSEIGQGTKAIITLNELA
ncbi:HAMP domain-containing sensor histidine kinase [Bacillus suaedae]|uniref:histidine kinase n=1 Tax=Halalkalibacter suaedae TaxID=2822140 RepID=A0A941ATG3_9BACI|nr:ATP-binding protein [Bacillus suaedae]MBP3951659.1 HAMP domain-containing protein [Bacillus suaedae]